MGLLIWKGVRFLGVIGFVNFGRKKKMKKGYNNWVQMDEVNECLVSICLGLDCCSEHEWGIKGIKNLFGIELDENAVGVDKRKVTKVPKFEGSGSSVYGHELQLRIEDDYAILSICNGSSKDESVQTLMKLYRLTPTEFDLKRISAGLIPFFLGTTWDESGFAIAIDSKYFLILFNLFIAFQENDIIFWFPKGN